MKLLTRAEELVLLAIWGLQGDAYSVKIREKLIEDTGTFWSFGGVYMPLNRLSKIGYLESHLTEPTQDRGGRSKRVYKLTADGREALVKIRQVTEKMWSKNPKISFEKGS